MRKTISTGRRIKQTVAIASLAFLVVGLAACSSRDASSDAATTSTAKVTKIAIVTPETEADHGWNEQGLAGAKAAATELGVELSENTNVGYDNTQTILTQVAQDGNQLVIVHASGFATAAEKANAATGVPMLIATNGTSVLGKIGVITFEAQEGAYLAGIAAAMQTKTNNVGIVVSADDVNWFTMSGGFIQGVRSVNPDIKINIAYIGAAGYADSAGGKRVTDQVIAAGADVIIGFGDGATIGYIAAVEAAPSPVKYIATIGDVTSLVKDPSTVLTSVRWNFKDTIVKAVKDLDAGTFGASPYVLTVANGGLSLQDSPALTAAMKTAVATATAGIIDGSITIQRTASKDEVTTLLNQ